MNCELRLLCKYCMQHFGRFVESRSQGRIWVKRVYLAIVQRPLIGWLHLPRYYTLALLRVSHLSITARLLLIAKPAVALSSRLSFVGHLQWDWDQSAQSKRASQERLGWSVIRTITGAFFPVYNAALSLLSSRCITSVDNELFDSSLDFRLLRSDHSWFRFRLCWVLELTYESRGRDIFTCCRHLASLWRQTMERNVTRFVVVVIVIADVMTSTALLKTAVNNKRRNMFAR